MNRQPNLNSQAIRNLSSVATNLSKKENAMNRRIATVLFALFTALVLSACAMPYPFQATGSVTVLPKEAASGMQINDRQQLADYQASLPAISLVAVTPKTAEASGVQINDRQQLTEYQASLTAVSLVSTAPKTVKSSGVQINNRQQLAEYQATLPLHTATTTAAVATVQQINDRQALADYQASLR